MGVFARKYAALPFITFRWFWDTFLCRFIWFKVNLRNFNPRKITFSVGFCYKNFFAQSSPTTGHRQSDVEFEVLKKPRKSRKNHEFSRTSEKNFVFFCTSECVFSYGLVNTNISKNRKNFVESSEFSLSIPW